MKPRAPNLSPVGVDDRVAELLSRRPLKLGDLTLYLQRVASRDEIVHALRRLKHAGKARSNVRHPTTEWHLTRGKCPCDACVERAERKP